MNSYVNHRGIKMRENNKPFSSLHVIDGKYSSYVSKVILRYYHYWLDPKLVPGIVEIIITPYSFHDFTTIISLYWYLNTKE